MKFEGQPSSQYLQETPPAKVLAEHFSKLTTEEGNRSVFEELEQTLEINNYELADNNTAYEILHDDSLLCRSENFSRVINLIQEQTPIEIENSEELPNMCTMSSTNGYRVAMSEGFSGEDVGNTVKVVVSFRGSHINNRGHVSREDDLWKFKPQTAEVSIVGSGTIYPEDVEMASFRFPIHLYPEQKLSEHELEMLENEEIQFIVRHYTKKKTTH